MLELPRATRQATEFLPPSPAKDPDAYRRFVDRLVRHCAGRVPPQLQMFMRGCPKELEAKRHRINCRELVMRNLLALSAGVRRTVCWNLAPDIPNYSNPLSIMDLLFGKLVLMDYEGSELRHRYPSAATFALLADRLAGVEHVTRLEVPGPPNLVVFEARRHRRGRCWWSGTSAIPSPGRTSHRWRLTGRGQQHGQSLSTHWARRNLPRCSMAA